MTADSEFWVNPVRLENGLCIDKNEQTRNIPVIMCEIPRMIHDTAYSAPLGDKIDLTVILTHDNNIKICDMRDVICDGKGDDDT